MRDPMNYEPAPYTEAAILVSPTPAWRISAAWHVPDFRYVEDDSESLTTLIEHSRTSLLYGGSCTARLCNQRRLTSTLISEGNVSLLDAVAKRSPHVTSTKRQIERCRAIQSSTNQRCVHRAGHYGPHQTQEYLDSIRGVS